MSMGDYQKAILSTDSCINIDANRPSSYFERGMIKDKLADIKGAILFSNSIPSMPLPLLILGSYCLQ